MAIIHAKSFTLSVYSQGDKSASKLALVLPGKLDTKDYANMRAHVDFLAQRGFFALSFDPPGTWESEGDISLYTMSNYLKAIHELIDYFGNKPTFAMGHSRGASMSIIAALQHPLVTSFAAIFPSLKVDGTWEKSNVEEWKEEGYHMSMRDLPPGGGPEVVEFKLPYAFYEDQLQYDIRIITALQKSTKPKLFFVGKNDPLVNPQNVRELYAVAGEPKELHELDSDHDYRFHKDLIEEVNTALGDFLEKYQI